MADLDELLRLLYEAHRYVNAMAAEISDRTMNRASTALMAQSTGDGRFRLRWAGGGPNPHERVAVRRVWFASPDRMRVEIANGQVVTRIAVRNASGWWSWDPNEGESQGEAKKPAEFPPILRVPFLHPAQLLHTMWFEVTGRGERAHRRILKAIGIPREKRRDARHLEFEFDQEHGTPLRIAGFDSNVCTYVTEVTTVDYAVTLEPAIFRFEKRESSSSAPIPQRP